MATRADARILFDALNLEGGLLPPEWLSKVAALEAPAQQPADYAVPKGLELRDEITRYWRIAEALYADFAKQREHAKDGGERAADVFIAGLLRQVLGFDKLVAGGSREINGRVFRIGYEWSDARVPVVVGAAGEGLDTLSSRHGDGGRRRSAWGALQEYLNAADDCLWGIASNGLRLRIGRDNTSLTRPAWIEADLERIFDEDRFADFSVLWLVLHGSRFAGEPAECPLERWRDAAREEGVTARGKLRIGVEDALKALGEGFLAEPSNTALRHALTSGELTPGEYFNELLRLVYRMIFLVTVEERGILHGDDVAADTRALYNDGYSMRRLAERSVRRSQRDRHRDKWAALRPVFAALGRAGGEPRLGLPELGGLFAPGQCPHLDTSELGNRALLEAVFRLGWLRQSSGLSRVNWKDMGPEELGSIYESLLELVPRIGDDGRSFTFAGTGESAGNERKLTGSYYTPDSLVQQLLDTALEPVIDERLAAADDLERALLSITVIDPACGSGHFLLAAARRLATRLASVRTGGTPGAHEYRLALRDVVTHCIHGVDRNPMALELARMSLWLETYTPDRALGFLDHHLVQGDALLGLLDLGVLKDGIPDAAFKALTGDDKAVAKTVAKLNRAALKQLPKRKHSKQVEATLRYPELSEAFAGLEELGDESIESVEAKRQRFEALRASAKESAAALAADLFLGAFLMPKRRDPGEKALTNSAAAARFPTTGTLLMALDGALSPDHTVAVVARAACRIAGVLHWPLVFPQVFARGGFDVVLGNPPWERIAIEDSEYFQVTAPEIASIQNTARRKAAIAKLEADAPLLYASYMAAKDLSERVATFFQGSAFFVRSARGRLNTYPLFTERAGQLASPTGAVGIIVQSGILFDEPMQAMSSWLTTECGLSSFVDFENRNQAFRGVDSRTRFCLLTFWPSAEASKDVLLATGLLNPSDLNDHRRVYRVERSDLAIVSPRSKQPLVSRSKADYQLARKIYMNSSVLDHAGSSQHARAWVGMTSASHSQYIVDMVGQGGGGFEVVYEGKLIHQYDSRYATFKGCLPVEAEKGKARPVSPADKCEPVEARFMVPEAVAKEFLSSKNGDRKWLPVYRDYCRTTDERTMIAAVIPSRPILQPLNGWSASDAQKVAMVLGALNSLPLDFIARQRFVGTHLNVTTFSQLPLPKKLCDGDKFILQRVLLLTYTAADLRGWAEDLGFSGKPFLWNEAERAVARAELDAYYARLYGLNREELLYILDPAEVMGTDYPSETFRVLREKEERAYGEYRTARLVIEAWDRLAAAATQQTIGAVPASA